MTEGKAASDHGGTYCSKYPSRPSASDLGDEMKITLIKFAICLHIAYVCLHIPSSGGRVDRLIGGGCKHVREQNLNVK